MARSVRVISGSFATTRTAHNKREDPSGFALDTLPDLLTEAAMPTNVYFVGTEKPLKAAEAYDKVSADLIGNNSVQLTEFAGEQRVTVYRSSIAYIEEVIENEIPLAQGV
jgi:hypothetical protein